MSGVDDGSIADDWILLRRVHPDQIVPDKKTGELRVSSGAFRDLNMSVDVEEILKKNGENYMFSLAAYPLHSLVRLLAAIPRKYGQAVVASPLPENPAHAEIKGAKSGSVARALAAETSWAHRR